MGDSKPAADRHQAGYWLQLAKGHQRQGELLRAYDAATKGLARHPGEVWLQHRAVLALARAGATRMALKRYEGFALDRRACEHEDLASLRPRLTKDLALAATGEERRHLAAEAARGYAEVYDRFSTYYPGINAATMSLLAGEPERARELACQILAQLDRLGSAEGTEGYYRAATAAEAQLLLGDVAAAQTAMDRAVAAEAGDLSERAVTLKQLRLVCTSAGLDLDWLDRYRPPPVVHFCGHIISAPGREGRFLASEEEQVATAIEARLDALRVGFGYGPIAAGADILVAEALLARGAELHIVMPFRTDEFIDVSVAPSGTGWVKRFRRCLKQATSVVFATQDRYLGDDELFGYATRLAMGLALLRARYLGAEVRQVAVWDGQPPVGPAGTGADVAQWRSLGLEQSIIDLPPRMAPPSTQAAPAASSAAGATPARIGREQRAMLFGDIHGFSKLGDRELPVFVHEVLGALARVIEGFGDRILFRNTWGDGLFLVLRRVTDAARCALALQEAIQRLPLAELGLPPHIALRLGGHFGPVYKSLDPVLGVENFFGAHVSRTARIEPVTPEGCVYVSEPFAAILALEAGHDFACDYVGNQAAAKHYGRMAMYLLRASARGETR